MMNIKKIERASRIVSEIKALDKEIISIEKIAQVIADGKSMKIEIQTEAPAEGKKETILDEDGSLISPQDNTPLGALARQWILHLGGATPTSTNMERIVKHQFELTDGDALNILAVLLRVKQTQREMLLQKVDSL